MQEQRKKVYHYELKNRAGVSATLRGLVALYICYLGYRTTPLYAEPDGLSAAMAWVLGAALVVAVLRYRRDLAAAEYTPEEYAELAAREAEENEV